MTVATYRVPEEKLEGLHLAIETLNKKARKLGQTPIRLTIPEEPSEMTEYFASDYDREMNIVSVRRWYSVEVDGETPRYAGWRFVATLTRVGEMTMVTGVPGETFDPEWRQLNPSTCAHCKTDRRRNETFMLRHDDGRYVQVGRNCLRDFLGHEDPHSLASWAEVLCGLGALVGGFCEEGWGGGGYREPRWQLESVLRYSSAVIRVRGWVSRTMANEYGKRATSSDVRLMLEGPKDKWEQKEYDELRRDIDKADMDDAQAARDCIAFWTEELKKPELGDYEYNLLVTLKADSVIPKTFGLAVSMIPGWQRAIGLRAERAAREKAGASSRHQGQIKERLNLSGLQVVFMKAMEGQYGVTTLIKLQDEAGNSYTWFKSGSSTWTVGTRLQGKGTVKAHDEYQGVQQTVLTRCDFIEM